MDKFKYLRVTTNDFMYGKQEITKDYLISVVSYEDALINLEDMTYFDAAKNQWLQIEGDTPKKEQGS